MMFTLMVEDILDATALITIVAPAYCFLYGVAVVSIMNGLSTNVPFKVWLDRMRALAFGLGGCFIGINLTANALLLGRSMSPTAPLPQTTQMFASNLIFDGISVGATIAILYWGVARNRLFRIPVAILLDLVVSVVTACCSLYVGLVFTDNALSVAQTLHVLIGRSPDGLRIDLSPYFWVMHTAFIPTLLYCVTILMCWLAKAFLLPVRWFFGKGQELKNPLKLTAGIFALLAAVLAILAFVASSAEERVNKPKGRPTLSTSSISIIHEPGPLVMRDSR
jgi:hypothetical protein